MKNISDWISQNFDAIPNRVVAKLMFDYDSVWELDDPKLDEEELTYREPLPIWGTMWVLNAYMQNYMDEEDMQIFWDNGFRIYDSEDLGYVVGIDGAEYNFYEHHWEGLEKDLRRELQT